MADGDGLEEDLSDLKENQTMRLLFDAAELKNFWCSMNAAILEIEYKTTDYFDIFRRNIQYLFKFG